MQNIFSASSWPAEPTEIVGILNLPHYKTTIFNFVGGSMKLICSYTILQHTFFQVVYQRM